MEGIKQNLMDPSWWFSGIFFICLTLLMPWALKHFRSWLKAWGKASRVKTLRKIKNLRHQKWQIHYLIAIERSYFLAFLITSLFCLIILVVSPFSYLTRGNVLLTIILFSPALIVEILWLLKRDSLKLLIKYADKLR